MLKSLAPIALLIALASVVMANPVSPSVIKELAPSGTLRAAINLGNQVLAQKDASGAPKGITVDLARELGRRLGVPVELVTFDAAGKVFDALRKDAWDVAFMAVDPARATGIDFTAPYVVIEGTYLVPSGSAIRANEEVDRAGIRIAVAKGSAYDLYLTRAIKAATLARQPTGPESLNHFLADKIEVAAGVKQANATFLAAHPELRMLPGRFMAIEQAMGTPKGRPAGAQYLRAFIEEMKASGFVARALQASGQNDAAVAPPAQ